MTRHRLKDIEILAHIDMAQATVDDLLLALQEYWDGDLEVTLNSGTARITLQADAIGSLLVALRQKIEETIRDRSAFEAELTNRGVTVCRPA